MRFLRALCIAACALTLGGCNFSEYLDRLVPDDARVTLDSVLEAVSSHDTDTLAALVNPEFDATEVATNLDAMLELLPAGPANEILLTTINSSSHTATNSSGTRTLTTLHTMNWADERFAVRTELVSVGGGDWYIEALRLQDITAAASPPLSLAELGLSQKIMGGLAILVSLFVLFTLVAMFRTPRIKRRILWTLFILLGCYPQFAVNWSTGVWRLVSPAIQTTDAGIHFKFFNILLLGASVMREGFVGPWIVSVCVPAGALFFWYRRSRGGPTRKTPSEDRLEGGSA
ncbi:hypothetical protein [Maricaulis sp.]|uniref:hypothetical protein n=1 Tax=Maricaulis sp. TaxID=1486257 RepID=UPI003A8D811E